MKTKKIYPTIKIKEGGIWLETTIVHTLEENINDFTKDKDVLDIKIFQGGEFDYAYVLYREL